MTRGHDMSHANHGIVDTDIKSKLVEITKFHSIL